MKKDCLEKYEYGIIDAPQLSRKGIARQEEDLENSEEKVSLGKK